MQPAIEIFQFVLNIWKEPGRAQCTVSFPSAANETANQNPPPAGVHP
jgi:hypothetical protein